MRLARRIAPWLFGVAALSTSLASLAQHDFDPSGRRRSGQRGGRPSGGGEDLARRDKKKPSADELIDRYTKALLSNPSSSFPLQKLAELYRNRDGNLAGMIGDFEKRAAAASPDEQVQAKLALAGVYLSARRRSEATKLLDELARDKPSLVAPHLMRASLAESEGDRGVAVQHYEAALPLVKEQADKERIVRQLMLLALELKDFDGAKKRHQELVKLSGGSLFVKKELGNELLSRGAYSRAEEEFREVVRAASGDNRALAPALSDLGEALAKQKKLDEALEVLNRARALAGPQAGIRNEILAILTEVYREQGKLALLITILEKETSREFQRIATIGQLYEETGQVDKAIKAYRDAVSIDGGDVDVRVKLVHLLQTAGQLDDAIREYHALIKAAPDSAEYVFELSETLIQRGERTKALDLIAELERRNADNGDVLATVADFYERIEEAARAVKVFERLAALPDGDPQYLVELGDRYFQNDDKPRALATWRRILTVVHNRGEALAMLAEAYLEHDMADEALEALREAVRLNPKVIRYKKQLATALEKTASATSGSQFRFREALQIWQELLAQAGDDALLARDCRNHIVGTWAILHELARRVQPLQTRLAAEPPDLESGRLLAEVLRRLSKLPEAEAALRRVVTFAPGDEQSLLALERVLVLQRQLTSAIDILKKLVDVNPKKAREYFQRMAQYAAELYRDDDAIDYASRALDLSPDDAEGHYRLAAMHRRRQQIDKATGELRKAIAKNQKLYKAYFDLAELLLTNGEVDEADRLYRQVLRSARDEEFVIRAARLSMQVHTGKGTLASLEHELLPVALGNPQKSVYRRLLVELYGNMTFPLVQAARLGKTAGAREAREQLAAIGARAVKPLLDALSDNGAAQQRIAIEVLAYVQNKGAGPALFNFALSRAELDLRVRAMVACGALSDAALLPRYQELLAPAEGGAGAGASDPVAVAAAWGVARLADPKAESLLLSLVESGTPEIRALAAVGLGLGHNAKHSHLLAKLARSPDAGPLARAAAVHALGELGDRSQRSLLLALTESSDSQVQLSSFLALARLDGLAEGKRANGDAARGPSDGPRIAADLAAVLARALVSERPRLRKTAMAAAAALVTRDYRRPGSAMPVPDGAVSLTDVLAQLAPDGYSRAEQVRALLALAEPLNQAAGAAVAASAEQANVVSELVLAKLSPLVDAALFGRGPGAEGTSDAHSEEELSRAADAMARASVRGFVALASHPSPEVRKRAVELLARRDEPEARAAIVAALDGRDAEVCRAALAALEHPSSEAILVAIVSLLEKAETWSLRARAAESLGRARDLAGETRKRIGEALLRTAKADSFALVREAALSALAIHDLGSAKTLAQSIAATDDEPRLRQVAREIVSRH